MKEITVISAVWCPSCLILKKHLKKIREKNNINIKYLDYDFDEEEVKKYDTGDILPVVITEKGRLIGERSYEELEKFLKESGVL